jgi:Domain of unknown function (DUF1707)
MAARAGDGGRLRASHADREQVIGSLKAAFVQGRLDKDEFDLRVGQALASRTYAELAAVTADIPAGPDLARLRGHGRAQDQQPVLRPGPVIMAAGAFYAGVWGVAYLTAKHGDGHAAVELVMLTTLIYLMVSVVAGAVVLASRHQKHAGGELPQRPGPGTDGRASWQAPFGPAGQLPPIDHGQQHTAEAVRSDRAGPQSSGSRRLARLANGFANNGSGQLRMQLGPCRRLRPL